MNRIVIVLLIMSFPCTLLASINVKAILATVKLKHKWQSQCNGTMCGYKSTFKPPAPFPGKNEAVMTVEVMPLKHKSMDALLKSEMVGVRKTLEIDEDLGAAEPDGKDEEAYVTLVTLYSGHQDETRADQIAILKALAKGMQ